MLYQPTHNQTFIFIYNILIEIYIGFTVFLLFFGIFMNYFYDTYLENKLSNDLTKSLSFYNLNNKNNIIKNLQDSNDYDKTEIKKIKDNISKTKQKRINILIYFIISINLLLLLLIIIPLILGIIPFSSINLKAITINFIIHLIFVVFFEIILFYYILPYLKIVNISKAIDS